MSEIYQFGNGDNWNSLYSVTKSADQEFPASISRFFPIPDFIAPVTTESRAIAILIESNDNPGNWKKGGYCRQKVQTGVLTGGQRDSIISQKFLQIDQINIFQLDPAVPESALEFSVPFYFKHYSLTVWEYVGEIRNTVNEQFLAIQSIITDCCDELKTLTAQSDIDQSQNIEAIIDRLSNSESLLQGIQGSIDSQELSNEPSEIPQEQIDELLGFVANSNNNINENLSNLSNTLSGVLSGDSDPSTLANIIQTDLLDEFI